MRDMLGGGGGLLVDHLGGALALDGEGKLSFGAAWRAGRVGRGRLQKRRRVLSLLRRERCLFCSGFDGLANDAARVFDAACFCCESVEEVTSAVKVQQ